MDLQKLRFPIGEYAPNKKPSKALFKNWIAEIENFPSKLNSALEGISIEKLNFKYRPDGWTVKQVIHHCADSHMNSIIRFKLALTEETPEIRPYFEDRWANLIDSQDDDISGSLALLKGLHKKWSVLLKGLTEEQLKLEFVHPEQEKKIKLSDNIEFYAWHCQHHLAHIKNGIESNGKYN